jgi:type II secretory pathway component GspD/PulD (secretin)
MGSLFKRKIKGKTRAELIILMQPRVMETREEVADLTAAESERVDAATDLDSTVDAASGQRAVKVKITPTPTPVIRVPR